MPVYTTGKDVSPSGLAGTAFDPEPGLAVSLTQPQFVVTLSKDLEKAGSMLNFFCSFLKRNFLLSLGATLLFLTSCNSPNDIPGGKVVDVKSFGEDLGEEDLVLVKFGATWCGPCRAVEKELDSLDSEKLGVKIIKVDVDEQPNLKQQFKIGGIPHLLLVRNGKTLGERIGSQSADELTRWIQRYQ
jgi:thioredoxin 1